LARLTGPSRTFSGYVMTLEQAATLIGTAIALATLLKGVFEYSAQGAQKRAEQFFLLRKRLFENASFQRICAMLRDENPQLAAVPFEEKAEFLTLFEEVALMMNSGLIRESVAHYMFGYYAIMSWDSDYFWSGLTRESDYWKVFSDFARRMKEREKHFHYSPEEFHL
jgi:hypothetical protein